MRKMSRRYQSDAVGNVWSQNTSPLFSEDDKKVSQLDPLEVLRRAPNFSEVSGNSMLESKGYGETRMCDYRPPGSERLRRREELVIEIMNRRCRLLLIYGEMFLGKAHFARQIIKDLRDYGFQKRFPIHCRGLTSSESLMRSLASSLGISPPYTDSNVIARLTSGSWNFRLIIFFTNLEDIVANENMLCRFSTFLDDMFAACPNVSVIVTSQVKVHILHQDFSITYKLDPPSEVECCRLLQPILRFCKTYEPIFLIVRRCFYRPGFILRVCHIILSNRTILTPEDIAEMLKSPTGVLDLFSRFPTPEGSLTEAIKSQLSRLPAELESEARMLCNLDGTFGMLEATHMLKRKALTQFKVMTLLPLKDHAILDIDVCTKLIRIDPLIRQFILNGSKFLRDNDPHKKHIVDFLGYILKMVRLDISMQTKGRALGFAHDNYHCLERTLSKAVHTCGEESYDVYMKSIELLEGSMSLMCPEKAVPFYEAMIEASSKFGTSRDRALLQGLYAATLIERRGCELHSAMAMVTDSLTAIADDEVYFRVLLLRKLCWMHIRLGNNKEAKRRLTEAMMLSTRVPLCLETRIKPHRILINSHLALVNVYLGNLQEANNLLVSTIPQARKVMPGHPVLAVLLQTMGHKLEREGLLDKAIISYKVSGYERRKFVETLPTYLVANQNSLASMYLWRGETERALNLIESSLNIRRRLGWWDHDTAETLENRGNAYLFSCRPGDAERSFNQAIEVSLHCAPGRPGIVNIRVSLAHAHMVEGRRPEAERQLQEALVYSAEFQRNVNEYSLLTALEHLVLMKRGTAEGGDIHKRLIQEAQRLSDLSKDVEPFKYVLMQRKLTNWRVYLGLVLGGTESKGQRDGQGRIAEKTQAYNARNSALVNEGGLGADIAKLKHGRQYLMDPSTETTLKLDWRILFTCEHCKMLRFTYENWL